MLARPEEDALAALEALADAWVRRPEPVSCTRAAGAADGDELNVDTLTAVIGALLPDDAIVVDEAVTASFLFQDRTAGAPASTTTCS